MQVESFIKFGYPFISSHTLSTLLEPEPLFFMNCLWMPCEVQLNVDKWLSAFKLHGFTTSWSSKLKDVLWCCDWVRIDMHLEMVIEWVWIYTWRLRWSEPRDALWGSNRARFEMPLMVVFVTVQDSRFRSGRKSKQKYCQICGPGCWYTRTVISDTVWQISSKLTELGGLSVGYPVGPSGDLYNALVFAVW
jgi:hypothetical protein